MNIGDRLRAARLAVGDTQEQVAAKAGMNVTQYNGYERGRSRPTPQTMQRLAVALATDSATLSGEPHITVADGETTTAVSSTIEKLRDAFRADVAAILGIAAKHIEVRIELR